MFWFILETAMTILFIVFLVATLRILFVFFKNIKKNVVLNKSVSKSVFKRKLSLVVILLFFGVSFALVGGMQLSATSGQNSLLKQYNNNQVYQYELVKNPGIENKDKIYSNLLKKYNEEEGENVDTSVISSINAHFYLDSANALTKNSITKTYTYFSKEYSFEKQAPGFKKWMSNKGYNQYIDDFDFVMDGTSLTQKAPILFSKDKAEKYWIKYVLDNFNGSLLQNSVIIKDVYKYIYSSNDGDFINTVRNFWVDKNLGITKNNNKFAYESYMNITPNGNNTNKDFEIKLSDDIFYNKKSQNINKTTFSSGKTYKQYLAETERPPESKGSKKIFNVIVQEDYLRANNIKVGDIIPFNNSAAFKVWDSVKFNEVTYPIMGVNLLPDEKKQAFIGMSSSEFINFKKTIGEGSYESITSRTPSLFFRLDDKKHSLKEWTGEKNTFEKERNSTYEDKAISLSKGYSTFKNEDLTEYDNYFNLDKSISLSYDFNSVESARMTVGASEMSSYSDIINIFIILFMTIVLIVLSMLISKRITDSGKELGTLKAMGMKNKSIASSYILFPVIIILLGFVIASLLSPLIMLLFNSILSKYYYISFAANPVSFSFFSGLLLIPLVLSIGLCYFISIRTLSKPTLDLLSNKGKDAPNILVRSAGYVTPKWMPFSISYAGKGILRAMGKSTLLFISIFLSVFLTAFSMATTTMIEQQTQNSLSHLNYDTVSILQNRNIGQLKTNKMFGAAGSANNYVTSYGADKSSYYTSFKKDLKNVSSLIKGNSLFKAHEKYTNYLTTQLTKPNKSNDGRSQFLPSYIIVEEILAGYLFNGVTEYNKSISIYEWEKENSKMLNPNSITFIKLSEFNTRWITYISIGWKGTNFGDIINFNQKNLDFESKMTKLFEQLPDFVIGDIYYNQYANAISQYSRVTILPKSIDNTKDVYDEFHEENTNFKEMGIKSTSLSFSIFNDKESFINTWGTVESGIDKWKYFDDDYKKIINGGKLDYIPVIASTQTMLKLKTWENKKLPNTGAPLLEKDGDIYTLNLDVETKFKTNNVNNIDNKSGFEQKTTGIKVKFKVVDESFVGIDFGFVTSGEFYKSYFSQMKHYSFISKNNGQTYSGNKIHSDKFNSDEYIATNGTGILGLENTFGLLAPTIANQLKTYKIDQIKKYSTPEQNAELDKTNVNDLKNVMSPLTLSWKSSAYTENETPPNNPSIYMFLNGNGLNSDFFTYDNGLLLPLNLLLSQGSKVYDMIMGIFAIMSVFILFMATTIILISLKDIIDSSKREVSMLKAFGYSNTRATFLIMIPYILISFLALIVALPLSFAALGVVASILTTVTGSVFIFTLTIAQWLTLIGFIFGLIIILTILGYISFQRTNALEAINTTNE